MTNEEIIKKTNKRIGEIDKVLLDPNGLRKTALRKERKDQVEYRNAIADRLSDTKETTKGKAKGK